MGRMEVQVERRHKQAGVSCTCWSRARIAACEVAPGARDGEKSKNRPEPSFIYLHIYAATTAFALQLCINLHSLGT